MEKYTKGVQAVATKVVKRGGKQYVYFGVGYGEGESPDTNLYQVELSSPAKITAIPIGRPFAFPRETIDPLGEEVISVSVTGQSRDTILIYPTHGRQKTISNTWLVTGRGALERRYVLGYTVEGVGLFDFVKGQFVRPVVRVPGMVEHLARWTQQAWVHLLTR